MTTQTKIDPISELMDEHQAVLRLLEETSFLLAKAQASDQAQWVSRLDAMSAFFQNDVALHFRKEEEALFPAMEKHIGRENGPIAVMLQEHKAHNALLSHLGAAVAARDLEKVRSVWSDFSELLTMHIMKEDNILFPMANRMFSPGEKSEVGQKMGTLCLVQA